MNAVAGIMARISTIGWRPNGKSGQKASAGRRNCSKPLSVDVAILGALLIVDDALGDEHAS